MYEITYDGVVRKVDADTFFVDDGLVVFEKGMTRVAAFHKDMTQIITKVELVLDKSVK